MNSNQLVIALIFACITIGFCTMATCQGPNYSPIVAKTLYYEAGNQTEEGRKAVLSVIYNRAVERGLTFEEVCIEPKQFSCWNRKGKLADPPWDDAYKDCVKLAKNLQYGFKPIGPWNHYYNPNYASPEWGHEMTCRTVIGQHVFGKL